MVPLPARTPGLIALTAIVIFFSFAQSNSSFAAVLNVPSEFATIQEAIDAAENGDEIIVAPGTYVENLRMNGKNVNLHSIDPTDWSVVDSTILHGGFRTNVITFDGSENETCRVAGFKITEGGFLNSTFREQGSGIWGGTTALIENNHITGNIMTNTVVQPVGLTLPWRGGDQVVQRHHSEQHYRF